MPIRPGALKPPGKADFQNTKKGTSMTDRTITAKEKHVANE